MLAAAEPCLQPARCVHFSVWRWRLYFHSSERMPDLSELGPEPEHVELAASGQLRGTLSIRAAIPPVPSDLRKNKP
jgi:hypothetical protein